TPTRRPGPRRRGPPPMHRPTLSTRSTTAFTRGWIAPIHGTGAIHPSSGPVDPALPPPEEIVMRKLLVLAAACLGLSALAIGVVGIGPAVAKSSKPVTVDGKVNVKGTKDVSAKKSARLEIEADDFYFE